jgi:hypothetical protein
MRNKILTVGSLQDYPAPALDCVPQSQCQRFMAIVPAERAMVPKHRKS